MISDRRIRQLVQDEGLRVVNVMWEDTGRYLGSSVGPNISDVTIEVETEDEHGNARTFLMPVMRYDNFTDKTADVRLDGFRIRVGNHREGGRLETVTLEQFLESPHRYMSLPHSGTIKGGTLLADRDTHALVSAQSAFLPVRRGTKTSFYPVIFNYQSYEKNPAVLTLLVTRQGTSMTIIDNNRDTVGGAGSWGQRLYFNAAGERAPLTAERLADVVKAGVTSNGEKASSLGDDANLLMIVQVPLKVKRARRQSMAFGAAGADYSAAPMAEVAEEEGDMDVAVLGHGPTEGPYTELDGLTIERDPRFPVRVTVQFYQATATGTITAAHVEQLSSQIDKVYAKGDYVGSLVVPTEADTARPTNWYGVTTQPDGLSWKDFPGLVERFDKYGAEGFGFYGNRFRW